MKLLMDLLEAAEALGVDYETARGFVHSGALKAVRLQGRRKIQVRPEALADFIAAWEIPDPVVVPVQSRKRRELTRKPRGQNPANPKKQAETPWYLAVRRA